MPDETGERFLQRGWKTCRLLGVALLALWFFEAVAIFVTMASVGWSQAICKALHCKPADILDYQGAISGAKDAGPND